MLQQNLLLAGFALIVIGFVLVFAASFVGPNVGPNTKTQTKAAFVGFIGPFPIGFGTDKQTLYIALAIGAVMFVAFLIINLITKIR